jgi:phospholipid/cholesterol/gamma-HCH transport system permease protein
MTASAQPRPTAVPERPSKKAAQVFGVGAIGGRFISRGALTVRAVHWLWLFAFTNRARRGSGVDREFEDLGIGALKLVASASVLVGLIATFQAAYQLTEFSAEVMSSRAVGWFAARELGPVVVALLVVARSASAIAGEFASMTANGELDALRAMGLDPVKYLVAPKLAALLLALPALTIFADALMLLGGWAGGTLFLGFGGTFFLEEIRSAISIRDVGIGLAKSVLFAFIIGIVAADEGLAVDREVGSIGAAATRAVVYCMIGVLGADTIVNALFYFIPGLD